MFEEELKTMGIKEKIMVITWERKIVGKHHHIESVQAKVDQMLQHMKSFKDLFIEIFHKRLCYFLDADGKLISQYEY